MDLTQNRSKRYAFVLPRFRAGIIGGAETLMGNLASKLSQRGEDVTILTTCAKDNRTWNNELPPGEAVELGVRVIRFPVNDRNTDIWVPLQIAISEGLSLSIEDQLDWMRESVNSVELYSYLAKEGKRFDLIFFGPYLFGTTFWGSLIHPEKSVLVPCLHDEHQAYLEIIQSMFRQVRGALFNALPEMELARSLYGDIPGAEVGMGFLSEYKERPRYFKDDLPYIVYFGRKETGKNAQLLVDYFIEGKDRGLFGDTRLVIAGGGSFDDLGRPRAKQRQDVIDLVEVSEDDKKAILQHALCLCQPSTNESFSIVLMEAWLERTPVLVNAKCAVTRYHALESNGGLYFSSFEDFAGSIDFLLSNKESARDLGLAGETYVKGFYSWESVLSRFDRTMEIFD